MDYGSVPNASIGGMIFSLIIAVAIPIILAVLIKKRRDARVSSFFIGVLVFIVAAMILEGIFHWLIIGATGEIISGNTWLFAAYGGLAAAIFEETGRYLAVKKSISKRESGDALMYGVGHGGIEAIAVVGLVEINNIVMSLMINSGSIGDMLGIIDENMGAQPANQLLLALSTTPTWQFYVAGIERVFAIVLQILFSVLMYKGVVKGKKKYIALAYAIHFAVNFISVILGNKAGIIAAEGFLLAAAVAAFITIRRLDRDQEKISEGYI